jgi:hypothetical protein
MSLFSFYNPATKYKWVNLIWLIALVLFPIVLWLMPSDFFDNTGFEICPSKLFFDVECFGCGMTRAVMHMHHLDWMNAIFYYNYGIVIVYPALIILWFIWLKAAWRRHKQHFSGAQISPND